jgi:hypothetical protein
VRGDVACAKSGRFGKGWQGGNGGGLATVPRKGRGVEARVVVFFSHCFCFVSVF